MNSEKNMKKLKREFVKSLSIMVLALTLFATAAVAWFSSTDTSDVLSLTVSVEGESDGIYFGENVPIHRAVVLPAATKVDDSTISNKDFSKVLHIETFRIFATDAVNKANVSVVESHPYLHYYIIGNYNPANITDEDIAVEIQDDFPDYRDRDITINFAGSNSRERNVAVVFWADYNTTTAAAIQSGELSFNDVIVKFSAAE